MENLRFEAGLREISMIRKGLSQREFYHRVIEGLHKMDMDPITDEQVQKLQKVLREKGCVTYQEFAEKHPEIIQQAERRGARDLMESGHILGAVSMVHQMLVSTENAQFSLARMNEGRSHSFTYMWLQKSKVQLDMDEYYRKKLEDLEEYTKHSGQGEDAEGR